MENEKELGAEDALIAKIISDGEEEAAKILAAADKYYDETVQKAENAASEYIEAQRAETEAYIKNLKDGKETLGNLESKKILLAARQSLVETVYKRAVNKLGELNKKDCLDLIGKLISEYAEQGETVILPKDGEITAEEVSALDVVQKLGLKVEKTGMHGGGIILSGKQFDKDLSFAALADSVREKTESEVARKLFE